MELGVEPTCHIYFLVSFHDLGRFGEASNPKADGDRKDEGFLMCFACQQGTDDPLGRFFSHGFVP